MNDYICNSIWSMTLYRNKYRSESNRLKNWDYSSKGIYFLTFCTTNRECIFGDIVNGKMILNQNGAIVKQQIEKSIGIREKWQFHNWVIMPNHIHLLVEIKEVLPKYNYSTVRIIDNNIDIEILNIFLNNSEFNRFNNKDDSEKISSEDSDCSPNQSNENISNQPNEISSEDSDCSSYQPNENIPNQLKGISSEDSDCSPIQPNENISNQLKGISSEDSDCSPNQPKNEKLLYRRPKSISSFVAQFKSKTTKQINLLDNSNHSIWQSNYHDSIIWNHEIFKKVYYYIQNNPKNWNCDSLK